MYNWYGDRVERREWCKFASPLGRRTQPLLSPASESSGPLRFQATRASTPDLDADCESCVAPDSPNLSISWMNWMNQSSNAQMFSHDTMNQSSNAQMFSHDTMNQSSNAQMFSHDTMNQSSDTQMFSHDTMNQSSNTQMFSRDTMNQSSNAQMFSHDTCNMRNIQIWLKLRRNVRWFGFLYKRIPQQGSPFRERMQCTFSFFWKKKKTTLIHRILFFTFEAVCLVKSVLDENKKESTFFLTKKCVLFFKKKKRRKVLLHFLLNGLQGTMIEGSPWEVLPLTSRWWEKWKGDLKITAKWRTKPAHMRHLILWTVLTAIHWTWIV